MDNFIDNEKEQSKKVIETIQNIINCCTNLQYYSNNKIGILYITTMGIIEPRTYIIFLPFFDYNDYKSHTNMPYLFIQRFTINVSDVFYKWVFDKKTNIIGKIIDKTIYSWEIFTGDLDVNIIQNTITNEIENYEEWFEKKKNNNNMKIVIRNPMTYKVPFPVKDIEITITNNNILLNQYNY
jgi:hypothetical protein